MVGLGVRDAGYASDEAREPAPGLPRLRLDIPLQPRHAWTVEPGPVSYTHLTLPTNREV